MRRQSNERGLSGANMKEGKREGGWMAWIREESEKGK